MKGFVIAGTSSGVGKTSIATGLMSVLSRRYKVQPFKVGPDFIDPMYHSAATGRPGRNLDSFMMDDSAIRNLVGYASRGSDLCIIEGVRGLYEGLHGDDDIGSTAYVSKVLGLPVVLVVNAGSLNRSVAALVSGFRNFDPDVNIAGVIFNNVSGKQHSDKLDVVAKTYCRDLKVLGNVKKDRENVLDQRYLGLRTLHSSEKREIEPLERLTDPIDVDALMDIAETFPSDLPETSPYTERKAGLKAAVPFDDAYSFYYTENLECLEASGIKVKKFRPVCGEDIPDADIAYLGGGYPELYAEEISRNRNFLEGVKDMSDRGCPILGECGGLMSMCHTMKTKDSEYRMAGVFDAVADMVDKRHGPTYMNSKATDRNPIFKGVVKGHEYHYSEVIPSKNAVFGFSVDRGTGIAGGKDGLVIRNSIGTYMHQHCLSYGDWASGFVDAAEKKHN